MMLVRMMSREITRTDLSGFIANKEIPRVLKSVVHFIDDLSEIGIRQVEKFPCGRVYRRDIIVA